MSKNYNPTDIHQKEGQEQSKKLYRSISEHVRRLDDARSCARNVGDLFTPSLQILRSKFRDYCERLIFSDPALYGRKGEELLWRKGFYEVVSTAKRLKKQDYTPQEKCNIQAHINSGIGFYHHYISRLQFEFEFNLERLADFAIVVEKPDHLFMQQPKTNNNRKLSIELSEWSSQSVHRTLIYLGDLCRYKLEIYPNWDINLAIRYYSQAVFYKPEIGMPHNQMGTLATTFNLNHSLDAAYHYIRCLSSKIIFEGTENNLHRLFEKNSQFIEQLPIDQDIDTIIRPEPSEHVKRFISRFLLLTDIWFFSKKVPHIYNLCHQVNVDLRECLGYLKPVSSEIEEDKNDVEGSETDSVTSPPYLNSEIIFKIAAICLLCISKLQENQSHQISNVVAFSLALYSQIIQQVVGHIHDSVLNLPVPPEKNDYVNGIDKKKTKKKKKMRRRRKLKSDSDESELSENEHENEEETVSSSDDDFTTDNEIVSSSSDEEDAGKEGEKVPVVNGVIKDKIADCNVTSTVETTKSKEEILEISKRLDVNDMLEIIFEEHLLQSIKILSDWLRLDTDVLKSCGKSTRSLINQIVHLINLININVEKQKLQGITVDVEVLKENAGKIALPEDVVLKGVDILSGMQKEIDWGLIGGKTVSPKEEALLRIMKIVEFGHFLKGVPEAGVSYDEETKMFLVGVTEDAPSVSPTLIDELDLPEVENGQLNFKKFDEPKKAEGKGQLSKMKHMGQLWLAAEVRELENRVRGKTALSPYLVIDVDCLIKYTAMVRQLVFSRKFIVLVPTAVVSALDELKREKLEAREAIRWLENQFHHGNRFFRAQRPQERLPLPFIKYPKKKDKEASIYIQIIECCHYLAEQQKGASNLVTLLMGNSTALSNGQNREISYLGLANSAGVNLELITEFYAKWKKTTKGKR